MKLHHTIYNLTNEQYHHSEHTKPYISSSQLKWYLKSPLHFRHLMDNPDDDADKSDALRFGTMFHDCMQALASGYTTNAVFDAMRTFTPPINDKTGQPYGAATKAYKDAYNAFCEQCNNEARVLAIATAEEKEQLMAMINSMTDGKSETSQLINKLLRWGKPEVSHFAEIEGVKLKCRPDLETSNKIIDWKTTSSDDLSEDAINKLILNYGYHISAAMYQHIVHHITGKWKTFYLCIVSKVPPYDCIIVDMSNYAFRYIPDADIVIPSCGALEYRRLLDLHSKCTANNEWRGIESQIHSNTGRKILEINPPSWYTKKFAPEI